MSYDKLPKVWADKLLIPFHEMACPDEGVIMRSTLDKRVVNPYTQIGDGTNVVFKLILHRRLGGYDIYVAPDHVDVNVIIAYTSMSMTLERFPRHFHKRDDTISIIQETIHQKLEKKNHTRDMRSVNEEYRPMVFPDDILEDAALKAAKTIWAEILFRFTGEI